MKRVSFGAFGLFALAVVVLLSRDAFAQRGQGRGFGGGGFGAGNLMLLNQKSVQEELKLSAEQVKKFEEQSEKQRETFGGLRDLSGEERREKLQEQVKATDATIASTLDEGQLKRLKQIAMQQRGAAALADPEVADAVGLSAEQKEKIQGIQRTAFEEQRAQFQGGGGGGDGAERRKKFQEARAATNEKLLGVLSAEQKEKLKTLGGEPFKGEIQPPRRRGNRPGGADNSPPRDRVAGTRGAVSVFRMAAFRPDNDDDQRPDKSVGPRHRRPDRRDMADRHPPHRPHHPHVMHGQVGTPGDAWAHVERVLGDRRHPPRPSFDRRGPRGHNRDFAAGRDHRRGADHEHPFAGAHRKHHGPDFARHHFASHRGPRHDRDRGPYGYGHHRHPHHHFASWRPHRDDHGHHFGPPRGGDDRPHPPRFDRGSQRRDGQGQRGGDAGMQLARLQRQLEDVSRELSALQRQLRAQTQ